MLFSLKFDLLMNITATSNIAMSKYVLLDPSYISRLRHGTRNIPDNSGYECCFAKYFVHHCNTSYQKSAFLNAIGISDENAFNEPDKLIKYVASWLMLDEENPSDVLGTDYSQAQSKKSKINKTNVNNGGVSTFYGIDGRKEAIVTLLNKALSKKGPLTLLIYSDESDQWINDKSVFNYEWDSLLKKISSEGGKIKIIHKVSNNINEMFDVIYHWLPYYATGTIESFYYPKLRDGIYKRSLCVVVGVGAIFSTSIGQQGNVSPTFLTNDPLVVDSFINEFSSYLALCKPLIELCPPGACSYKAILHEHFSKKTAEFFISDTLPFASMPSSLVKDIEKRSKEKNDELENTFADFYNINAGNLNYSKVTHIIRLAKPDEVCKGNILVNSSLILSKNTINYTPSEYCKHLENILHLLDKYSNFEVLFSTEPTLGFSLHAFQDGAIFVFKETLPASILRITERNTALAFWQYFQYYRENLTEKISREETIFRIKSCIKKIKELS